MNRPRIGELLGKMGKLSEHDIDEILEEQEGTGHRFGDIALTWGLCQPEHIWKAWLDQVAAGNDRVDLQVVGIDSQAAGAMPGKLARQYHVMPVRMFDGELVVASRVPMDVETSSKLSKLLGMPVHVIFADAEQIASAIEAYYPVESPLPISA